MTDLNHYIKLIESAEQLDELNWKKGLATAATAGALALGSHGAHAQNYNSSPLHRDLSNISNKLDRDISATQQANKAANQAKSLAGAQIIMGGLKALGDALQNEKYKTQAETIMKSGPWKIYKSTSPTAFGEVTVVYGSGKFAVLMGTLVGTYDETSPGVLEKGRLVLDLNKGTFTTNPIFGTGENVRLKIADTSNDEADDANQKSQTNESFSFIKYLL